MRAGRSFRMILHAEDRQLLVAHSLDRTVIQIDVRYLHIRRKRVAVDGESVILRSDGHFARAQILYRLIGPAMAEFQFECRTAEREAENLMTKTNPEDRLFAHQIVHGFVCVWKRRGITWAVREKNSVGFKREHFFG